LIHNALQGAMQQHEEIVDKISKHDHSLVHIPSTGHPVKMIGMPFNQLVYKQLDLPLLLSGRTQRKCQSTERPTQNCTSVPSVTHHSPPKGGESALIMACIKVRTKLN